MVASRKTEWYVPLGVVDHDGEGREQEGGFALATALVRERSQYQKVAQAKPTREAKTK